MRLVCILCLAMLAAGCASLNGDRKQPESALVTEADLVMSKALAHYAQGLLYEAELGRASPWAVVAFQRAASLDPRYRTCVKASAGATMRNDYATAVRFLESACATEPDNPQAWTDLAAMHHMRGHYEKAAECYAAAIKLAPTNAFPQLALAQAFFRQNNVAKAVKTLEKAFKSVPNTGSVLIYSYNQGREFLEQGEVEKSAACFQFVADHAQTQRAKFYELIGEVYDGMGHGKQAEAYLSAATREPSAPPEPFLKLALLQMKADKDKALRTLEQARKIHPDSEAIRSLLAHTYGDLRQFPLALREFESIAAKAAASNAKLSSRFYLYYGSVCEQAGEISRAVEVFEKCLEIYPKSHQALNYLAYMWAERGEHLDKALEYVNRALELDPGNGAYLDTLGWIYYKQRRYKDALEQIQKACELTDNDSVVVDHLGDIFNAMENKDFAIQNWKKSFMLDPDNKSVAGKLTAHGINTEQLRKEALKALSEQKKGTQD